LLYQLLTITTSCFYEIFQSVRVESAFCWKEVSSSEYPGTENDANAALANLLPEKSNQVYEYAYQHFKTRCDDKNVKEAVTEKFL
jgi:hypothetical protein